MGLRCAGWWVDNTKHMLHGSSAAFACDREIVTLAEWQGHALLLSADTDCLSLWDACGLVRTIRVGVYPQDFAIADDTALVCGGLDGQLHRIALPDLHPCGTVPLPGLPGRIAMAGSAAFVLALMSEPEVHTALLCHPFPGGPVQLLLTLPGIPGALAADDAGLWLGVGEQVLHLPHGQTRPNWRIEGFTMPERITVLPGGLCITDAFSGRTTWLRPPSDRIEKERSPCDERS